MHPEELLGVRCRRAKEEASQVRQRLEDSSLELSTLVALGQLRHTLYVCASLLHDHMVLSPGQQELSRELRDLMAEMFVLSAVISSDWPK